MPENSGKFILKPKEVAGLDHFGIRKTRGELEELLEKEGITEKSSEIIKIEENLAKEILGKDFLGVEAVQKMEEVLSKAGKNVEFDIEGVPAIHYTERDLEIAKELKEMLVLRPKGALIGGKQEKISISFLKEIFKVDPLNSRQKMFYESDYQKELEKESFMKAKISFGWSLVKKKPLSESLGKNYNQQDKELETYGNNLKEKGATSLSIRRRNVSEVPWDTFLYYVNTGERLLSGLYDWTSTTAQSEFVDVGGFDAGGMRVGRLGPEVTNSNLGVCPSR